MTMDTTNHLIRRSRAVQQIADRIRQGGCYVIGAPPGLAGAVARALDGLTPWQAYVDNGGLVLRTGMRRPLDLHERLGPTTAVVIVPKPVDIDALAEALSCPAPAEEEPDVISLRAPNSPAHCTPLLVDALALVDPDLAARARAGCEAQ